MSNARNTLNHILKQQLRYRIEIILYKKIIILNNNIIFPCGKKYIAKNKMKETHRNDISLQ